MDDEQREFVEQDLEDTGRIVDEARIPKVEETASVQPTAVNPAAAHYVQQQEQAAVQRAASASTQAAVPQHALTEPSQYQQAQQQAQQQTQQAPRPSGPASPYAQQQYRPQQQVPYQAPQASQVPQAAQRQIVPVTVEKKQRTGFKSLLWGLLGGVLGALGVVFVLYSLGVIGPTRVVPQVQESSAGQTISITPDSQDVSVAQVVAAKALPSVVSVYVSSQEGSGMGSGVILDTDGNILTNWHVAGDAETISVTIGGKSYDATLVGGDASSDLAVVRAELNGDTVTPMEIGDSDALVVGDWVMTIGSPFGLDQSVSAGIVSSLARNELMQSTYGTTIYANLIQTDASINPGNSGGALVNSQGQLVGISTLFSSDTESFAGIGFAIPGNYAVEVANKIIAGEQVTHAYIGLSMQTVNAQNAAENNLPVNQGAYVAEVAAGSPAEAAGIQAGDIVISMGSQQITSADGMILAVRSHHIGETVPVTVMRGEEELTFDVTLGSDEELQALQQQQYEEQMQQWQEQQQQWQEQQQQYPEGYGDQNGDRYDEVFQELYDYLYNNSHGGSYVGE